MNTIFLPDHIMLIEDLFPEGYCAEVIKRFDELESRSVGWSRKPEGALANEKQDWAISFENEISYSLTGVNFKLFEGASMQDIFFEGLQKVYDEYTEKYSIIRSASPIVANNMKVQKTTKGQAYHVWHFEQGPEEKSRRVLTYILYLNTLTDEAGGETEFLYQGKRVKPKENTILVWPAAYTHTHRGNPVLTDEKKYIATGWFSYAN